ncbi:hypothetical protein [Halomonas sp.]|uniref:hypothetical protein n=1 Tax=Halomonas sp. TaxID=1486246 RepID=UPI003F92AF8D
MKNWCRKYYTNVILVGLVAAVGGVAAYLYIDQFGSNGFSKKSEDWANFATYISGTVGVAAVVATLIAFVITLRQQQALIDSQDKMIAKQEKQIKLTKKQLSNEKLSREVEFAYQASLNIFPVLLKSIDKRLVKGGINFYDNESGSFRLFINPLEYDSGGFIDNSEGIYFANGIRIQRLLLNLNAFESFGGSCFERLHSYDYGVDVCIRRRFDRHEFWRLSYAMMMWIKNSRLIVYADVIDSIHKVFKRVDEVTSFAVEKVRLNKDLKGFLEVRMDEPIEHLAVRDEQSYSVSYKLLALCYHAFLLGMHSENLYLSKVEYLDFPKNKEQLLQCRLDRAPMGYLDVLNNWYEIGAFLREKKPAS